MCKKPMVLLATLLAGCATPPVGGKFTNSTTPAVDQAIAASAVKKVAALYPPAKTRFELQHEVVDQFGAELITSLRQEGYAVIEFMAKGNSDVVALPLTYVLDETDQGNVYRLKLQTGNQSLSRLYKLSGVQTEPAGYWTRDTAGEAVSDPLTSLPYEQLVMLADHSASLSPSAYQAPQQQAATAPASAPIPAPVSVSAKAEKTPFITNLAAKTVPGTPSVSAKPANAMNAMLVEQIAVGESWVAGLERIARKHGYATVLWRLPDSQFSTLGLPVSAGMSFQGSNLSELMRDVEKKAGDVFRVHTDFMNNAVVFHDPREQIQVHQVKPGMLRDEALRLAAAYGYTATPADWRLPTDYQIHTGYPILTQRGDLATAMGELLAGYPVAGQLMRSQQRAFFMQQEGM